jgi:two-component system OmpR family response regulator
VDRIVGLEMGADDYLAKPFDPRELLARIKVVLRRTQSFPERARVDEASQLRFAGWRLDTATRQLRSPDGLVVSLGSSDYRLLRLFLQHPNRALSRDFCSTMCSTASANPSTAASMCASAACASTWATTRATRR